MSYIDIDRELSLHGRDTSSSAEIIRNLIALVLYMHEDKMTDEQFLLYEHFVDRLGSNDYVFTFNYDTILEKALTRKNKPYRLYDYRQQLDEKTGALLLAWKDEIIIFKMHGSINWFEKTSYDQWKKYNVEFVGTDKNPNHVVFDGKIDIKSHRLLDDPFSPDDPFKDMYIVDNLDKYFENANFSGESPFIVPPSYYKFVNLEYLRRYWYRFSTATVTDNKMAIIGFSLPDHDEYIRQPMCWFIRSFQEYNDPEVGKKAKLKLIDFKKDQKGIDGFKSNYRFVNQDKTIFYFGGFCEESLDTIFSED